MVSVLLLLGTGLAWAFTGVLLSYCARQRIAAVTLLGLGQALTAQPSHLPALRDPARLRVPLLSVSRPLTLEI